MTSLVSLSGKNKKYIINCIANTLGVKKKKSYVHNMGDTTMMITIIIKKVI